MSAYEDNDGRFPDDSPVLVRYPLDDPPGDRADWPWVPGHVLGHVLGQCGPDEWWVVVDGDDRLAEYDPTGEDPDGPLYPLCFRDSSELRDVHGVAAEDDDGPYWVEVNADPPKPPYGSPEREAYDRAEREAGR